MSPPLDWFQGVEAACARLIHPSVGDGGERARQLRLLQVLFAGPVLAAIATAQLAAPALGAAGVFAAVSMVFGIGLVLPFALIATARRKAVETAALALAAAVAALLVASGGGLAAPIAVLAAAPAIEAGWIARSRRALGFGAVAATIALGAGAGLAGTVLPDAAASAWQWIVPLIYAATVAARLPRTALGAEEETVEPEAPAFEDVIGAAVLRLQPAGEVVQASDRVEALVGVAPEMLLGTGLFDRIHVADRVTWLSALAELREGEKARTVRLRIRVPAEAGLPSEALYRFFVCDVVAAPEGPVAMLRDDAARAELEAALAEASRVAGEAARARDELLASVSHELRTPLNAIVGFSDVLASGMFGAFAHDKQREYVELIHQAGSHLLSVVNAILDVSRLQSGTYDLDKEPFPLEEAVELSMAVTARQAEAKAVALKADIAADVGTVHCDRRALQQVLINLLSNAVKFTPSGEVKVTARRHGERLEVTVSDTGIGMSAEELKRVGKPFAKVENDYTRQYDGTGLGLALVKGLVRLQGGGMSIESAPGAGTRVHVSLPAGAAEGPGEAEDGAAAGREVELNCEWNYDAIRKTA